MTPAYDLDAEQPTAPHESLVARELWANRRRFRREGVYAISGPRDRMHAVDNSEARRPMFVRAAVRLDEHTSFDAFVDRSKDGLVDALEHVSRFVLNIRHWSPMNAIGGAATGVALFLLILVAILQIAHHFNP